MAEQSRKIRILFLIAIYLFRGTCHRLFIRDPLRRRRKGIELTSYVSKKALAIFNAAIRQDGNLPPRADGTGRLIISNHMSYIDVLVISSLRPSVFVTSVETEQSPFIGVVSKFGGSLFVERRHKSRLRADIAMIAEVIKQGFDIVIFPEGTSTNGQGLLPFKKSLLSVAVEARTEVVPICLNYTSINGQKPTAAIADHIFYYGDMTFGPHFVNALRNLSKFEAQVTILDPISTDSESCRKEIATTAFEAINSYFRPIEKSL